MDIGEGRLLRLLVILGFMIHCVASDDQICRIEERLNMGLSKIFNPATILSVDYEYRSASDCYNACCSYIGNQCNAVSYYDTETLCMLVSCHPFANCVWVTADGFTAGRTRLTTVSDDVLPPNPLLIGSNMTSSTTSQHPVEITMSRGLGEGVTPTTTTIKVTATPTPSPTRGLEPSITQPLNVDLDPASPLSDNTSSLEISDWNVDSGSDIPAVEAAPNEVIPAVNPESSEQTTAAVAFQGDYNQTVDSTGNQTVDSTVNQTVDSTVNQTGDSLGNGAVEAGQPPVNTSNDSVSEEEWNVQDSIFSMSDDPNKSGQASETSTKGQTDDANRNASGPESTEEEPWNIDSFLSHNDGQPADLKIGQIDNGQLTDLNNGQIDIGQPSDLNSGQIYNGQPTVSNIGQIDIGQPTVSNIGQIDIGQPTVSNIGRIDIGQQSDLDSLQIYNGQPTASNIGQIDNGQPFDIGTGQGDTEQPTNYNSNDTESNFDDPWIIDPWLTSRIDDTDNDGQAENSDDNREPDDNWRTDDFKDDFSFTGDIFPQPKINDDELTTGSDADDDSQPADQQQQQQHFDDVVDPHSIDDWQSANFDAPAPSIPDGGESGLQEPPASIPEEDPNAKPREMKRMFIQSPGIIIGLCSALGVAFLVLLAVCRKVYLSHDRPHYKPLRDYDIRFEPPAASSALLP